MIAITRPNFAYLLLMRKPAFEIVLDHEAGSNITSRRDALFAGNLQNPKGIMWVSSHRKELCNDASKREW
jgi:hypothetical protein